MIDLNKVLLVCAFFSLLEDLLDLHEELLKVHAITLNMHLLQLDKLFQEK